MSKNIRQLIVNKYFTRNTIAVMNYYYNYQPNTIKLLSW